MPYTNDEYVIDNCLAKLKHRIEKGVILKVDNAEKLVKPSVSIKYFYQQL